MIPLVLILFFYFLYVFIIICKDVVSVQDDLEGLTQIQIWIQWSISKVMARNCLFVSLDVSQLKHLCSSVAAEVGRDWS